MDSHVVSKKMFRLTRRKSADDFVNNLDPDQAPQNVGPDLDPNCLTVDELHIFKLFYIEG